MQKETRYPHCRIFLREIRILCKIGIDSAEKEVRQTLLVDVEMTAGTGGGGRPDIDYAAVLGRLRAFADSKQHALMEDFATEAAGLILAEYGAAEVTVVCRKPSPFAGLGEAGVSVTRVADG